jgi:1,4-alpha-glucan branching enzyme
LRYNPRYYFAIETSYGTTSNLKEMIDELHKNGIRVIVDSVRKLIADS